MRKCVVVAVVMVLGLFCVLLTIGAYARSNAAYDKGLNLRSTTVSWTEEVDVGPLAVPNAIDNFINGVSVDQHVAHVISLVLHQPNGWSSAGVFFKYERRSATGISFVVLPPEAMISCVDAWGCTNMSNPRLCPIVLNAALFGQNPRVISEVINHEVGHCLGFTHTKTGLMQPVPPMPTVADSRPSAAMLQQVHDRIAQAAHS